MPSSGPTIHSHSSRNNWLTMFFFFCHSNFSSMESLHDLDHHRPSIDGHVMAVPPRGPRRGGRSPRGSPLVHRPRPPPPRHPVPGMARPPGPPPPPRPTCPRGGAFPTGPRLGPPPFARPPGRPISPRGSPRGAPRGRYPVGSPGRCPGPRTGGASSPRYQLSPNDAPGHPHHVPADQSQLPAEGSSRG